MFGALGTKTPRHSPNPKPIQASLLLCGTTSALYANCRTLSGAVPIEITFLCCDEVGSNMTPHTACEVEGHEVQEYQQCCFDHNRGMFISEIDHKRSSAWDW
ncbi:hypothetical protein EC968_000525 [Mortierella alpina]|nr:hypothetical protein EC968_000525 [Mortierella alpina]